MMEHWFKWFYFVGVLSCMWSYMNMDPMKSSFFLILSLLCCAPLISYLFNVWYSYYICLLFLSGIFVILVYFSSLSSYSLSRVYWVKFLFLVTYCTCYISFFLYVFFSMSSNVSLNNFYYDVFSGLFLWLILVLLLFMNFTSYFLNFSGALRKI